MIDISIKKIYNFLVNEEPKKLKLKRSINKYSVKTPNKENVIFLTIGDKKKQAYVVTGKGKNLRSAINDAVQKYFKYRPKNHKPKQLKVDFLHSYELINKDKGFNFKKDKLRYDRGGEGLAFGKDFHTVFLPSEVASFGIIRKQKLHVKNSFRALHKHLPTSFSPYTKPIDERSETTAYKIRTKTYYIDENNFFELYRNHRIFKKLTKKDILEAIELTKDNYFKHVVNKKGKFIYSYLPFENKREKRYNILRHAGTIYSMLEVYELMPDEKLLKEAKRAFKFLIRRIKPFIINGEEVKVVVERDSMKVGGNALAIVALAKYTQVTGDTQYVTLMQELASWLKENQNQNGEFIVHKQQYSTGEHFDFVSHYYPGEAILALVRLYQIDKNETWLDVAENAAHYLINIRDKDDTLETIAHDHWLLYGLNELYRERKKQLYLDHSFFISEAIMKTQITEETASREELIGGYVPRSGNEPNSTPVACRSEGLSASYKLAKDFGYHELAEKMKHAIKEGVKFQLQMQLRPESVMHYANKKLVTGAVQGGLKSLGLRIDFTQHNISSFVALYNILKNDD